MQAWIPKNRSVRKSTLERIAINLNSDAEMEDLFLISLHQEEFLLVIHSGHTDSKSPLRSQQNIQIFALAKSIIVSS